MFDFTPNDHLAQLPFFLSEDLTYTSVNQSVSQGNYYEIPADGWYYMNVGGGSTTGAAAWSIGAFSNGKIFFATQGSFNISMIIPFKKGTKVYTRPSIGNYFVSGYYSL